MTPALDNRELSINRFIAAPPERVYAAWTRPDLLKQWFAPLPVTVPKVELDVRVGGSTLIVMRLPDGTELPNRGVYLEVVPNRRLVFTDAYTEAWVPAARAFVTVIVTFDPEGAGTRYTARVLHWAAADRETHEKMGFHEGWNQCADQLARLVEG